VQNEIYNISGNYEIDNLTVAKKIIDYSGVLLDGQTYTDWLATDLIRQGMDVRYSIDDSKLKALGWEPQANFDTELKSVVDYYLTNFVW
jgi:dTDP-glucose 4,6-dehydratase